MSKKDIKVPNIGEFKDVEVIEVLVKKDQAIKKNDPLITIESDKSSVEIPSIDDGIISSVKVKVGDKVSEGDKILEIELSKDFIKDKPQELTDVINTEDNFQEIKPQKKENIQQRNLIIKDFSGE